MVSIRCSLASSPSTKLRSAFLEKSGGAFFLVLGCGAETEIGRFEQQALGALGVQRDVRIYPGAGHSYMSRHSGLMATLGAWGPMAVGFNAEAEADSWKRMEAFFRTHLG